MHDVANAPSRATLHEVKPTAGTRRSEPWRVAVVIPGYNRREDLEKLFKDLGRLDTRGITLWCVLVDNNSPQPLSTISVPANVRVEHYRLNENTGGAGGFGRGMARVLSGEGLSSQFDPPDFLWLLDSDVRVTRKALRHLLRVLVKHDDICAAGSALVDLTTRTTYEIGGRMEPKNGFFVPAARHDVDKRKLIEAHYLAACSTLVRREAVEKTGLMPDIFIHGDDVEWMLQMRKKTKQRIVGVPRSRVGHPLWNRKFQTWVRYYTTRNAYAPIDCMGFGAKTRFRRALVDVLRAWGQTITGMDELADLHLQGLEDAAACRTVGHHMKGGMGPIIQSTKAQPMSQLADAVREELAKRGTGASLWVHPLMQLRSKDLPGLKEELQKLNVKKPADWKYWHHRSLGSNPKSDIAKALWRGLIAQQADVSIVPTGVPSAWFRGDTQFLLTVDGFVIRRVTAHDRLKAGFKTLVRGMKAAIGCAKRTPTIHDLPPAPKRTTPIPSQVRVSGHMAAPSLNGTSSEHHEQVAVIR
ncbi:MAG: glycosyltransferase [Phycisphaerales bacterium]